MGDEGVEDMAVGREERRWELAAGCTMRVGSHGKKKPTDKVMVIDLLFSFEGDPFPRVYGKIIFIDHTGLGL